MTAVVLLLCSLALGLALVLVWVLLKTVKPVTSAAPQRTDLNVAIHDENLEELTQKSGVYDSDVESEVDAALLADLKAEQPVNTVETKQWVLGVFALAIPISALILYFGFWGRPGTVLLQEAAALIASETGADNATTIETLLLEYVNVHPEDGAAWNNLIAFQWYRNETEGFRESHAEAEARGFTSSFTDSLYLLDAFQQRELNFNGRDRIVRTRLEESRDPSPVLSMIKAFEHTMARDYPSANRAWESVLGTSDTFQLHNLAQIGQRATRTSFAPLDGPWVSVEVEVNEPVPDKQWLFVGAYEVGVNAPIAVVKRPLTNLRRYELVLDDSTTMLPGTSLSAAEEIHVIARLSSSADALADEQDLREVSAPLNPVLQPHARIVFGQDKRFVTVRVQSEEVVSPFEPLYIIVRNRLVSGPPLAVRRLYGLPPDTGAVLSVADLMLPDTNLDSSTPLEVQARVSRSQSAMPQPGDIESDALPFTIGDSVELELTNTI